MGIIEIKGKKLGVGPETSRIVEALVEDGANKKYVTVQFYDDEYYSVSDQSLYDCFVNDEDTAVEGLEEFDNYEEAKKSEYKEVFGALLKVMEVID